MKLDWIWDSRDSGSQEMDKNLEHKWQRKRKIEIKETVRVWKVTEIWNEKQQERESGPKMNQKRSGVGKIKSDWMLKGAERPGMWKRSIRFRFGPENGPNFEDAIKKKKIVKVDPEYHGPEYLIE